MSNIDTLIDENNLFFGILFTLIGAFLFIREGKKMIDDYLDEDYIMMSFSIKTFAASLMFLMIGFFLINRDLELL